MNLGSSVAAGRSGRTISPASSLIFTQKETEAKQTHLNIWRTKRTFQHRPLTWTPRSFTPKQKQRLCERRWERGDESHISALTLVVNEARCVYVLLEAVLKIPTEQGGAPSSVTSHWLLLKNRLTEYWGLEPRKLGPGEVISLLILNMRRFASFY